MTHAATYSIQDNKLRLYPGERLDAETYAKVKGAGFIWAAKQECFVTPAWTPLREDVLLGLVEEIEDESMTAQERAAMRAERFEGYSEKRTTESETAYQSARKIGEAIPFGQPILVGHHSERRARADVEKINNAMRKCVTLGETAKYWENRAEAALGHAAYKEKPEVRFRRKKGLEAELRSVERSIKKLELKGNCEKSIKHYQRWVTHLCNRIAYETRMLQGWEPKKVERVKPDLAPLCNFETEGCEKMTASEWKVKCRASEFYEVVNFSNDPNKKLGWREKGDYRHRAYRSISKGATPIFIVDLPVKYPPTQEKTTA